MFKLYNVHVAAYVQLLSDSSISHNQSHSLNRIVRWVFPLTWNFFGCLAPCVIVSCLVLFQFWWIHYIFVPALCLACTFAPCVVWMFAALPLNSVAFVLFVLHRAPGETQFRCSMHCTAMFTATVWVTIMCCFDNSRLQLSTLTTIKFWCPHEQNLTLVSPHQISSIYSLLFPLSLSSAAFSTMV